MNIQDRVRVKKPGRIKRYIDPTNKHLREREGVIISREIGTYSKQESFTVLFGEEDKEYGVFFADEIELVIDLGD